MRAKARHRIIEERDGTLKEWDPVCLGIRPRQAPTPKLDLRHQEGAISGARNVLDCISAFYSDHLRKRAPFGSIALRTHSFRSVSEARGCRTVNPSLGPPSQSSGGAEIPRAQKERKYCGVQLPRLSTFHGDRRTAPSRMDAP